MLACIKLVGQAMTRPKMPDALEPRRRWEPHAMTACINHSSDVLIQRDLGVEQFAGAISMTSIGVVLGATGTDYYPRLVAVLIEDAVAVNLPPPARWR